jgi:hypothetical protein
MFYLPLLLHKGLINLLLIQTFYALLDVLNAIRVAIIHQ